MIWIDIALLISIIMLAIKLWDCSATLDRAEYRIDLRGAEIRELEQRCDGHKELIEALSKSVRELNGVVEAAVKVKEETPDNKPDTKALIGGWTTDDGQARIDASNISAGMIDGKSVMNCELPNISDSAREKIFEMLGVKTPEDKPRLTAYDMDRVCGRTISGSLVWMDKRGHTHFTNFGD